MTKIARLKLDGQFGQDIPQPTLPNFPRLIAPLRNYPDKYARSLFQAAFAISLIFVQLWLSFDGGRKLLLERCRIWWWICSSDQRLSIKPRSACASWLSVLTVFEIIQVKANISSPLFDSKCTEFGQTYSHAPFFTIESKETDFNDINDIIIIMN